MGLAPHAVVGGLLALVLAGLAALHVHWAFGGRIGWVTVIPQVDGRPAFTPSPMATVMVALGLAGASALALIVAGLAPSPVPERLAHWGAVALGLVFVARAIGEFRLVGFFKRVRGTPFAVWDTWAFSLLCLAMGAAFLFLVW